MRWGGAVGDNNICPLRTKGKLFEIDMRRLLFKRKKKHEAAGLKRRGVGVTRVTWAWFFDTCAVCAGRVWMV